MKMQKKKKKQNISGLCLRFSPTAWAKILYFRDRDDTEIGGFGITESDDLLKVIDFVTVKQDVTAVSVNFDDESIADFYDSQVDIGRKPNQFSRIWIHTHPEICCEPSTVDNETFERVFGQCNWAAMMILSKCNEVYAKIRFNVGPTGELIIPVEVDYNNEFTSSDHKAWKQEYERNVRSQIWQDSNLLDDSIHRFSDDFELPASVMNDFEMMSPAERHAVLDELAVRQELWNEQDEEFYYE